MPNAKLPRRLLKGWVSKSTFLLCLWVLTISKLYPDWPIFKGNLYFTGNNDELIVKNNEIKWTFLADSAIQNPVVSDRRVFFIDLDGQVYCLNEDWGNLIWKMDLKKISSRFKASSPLAGKVKYPLVKDGLVLLTDPIALYALEAKTGQILWARTALRIEEAPTKSAGRQFKRYQVDGIYSDPVLSDGNVYYGSRNVFLSRSMRNGALKWKNSFIKSYSGFPNYFDEYLLTQSRDYLKNTFSLHLLNKDNGKTKWEKKLPPPLRIFPPVIYKNKVYVALSKALHCLAMESGDLIWKKALEGVITSPLSFTDRHLVISYDNRYVLVMDPDKGTISKKHDLGEKAAPKYVTIRDQLYLSSQKKIGKSVQSSLWAFDLITGKSLWHFQPPFPGGISQPSASGGILFMPAGPYLYAIGQRGDGEIKNPKNRNPLREKAGGSFDPKERKKVKIDLTDSKGKAISGKITLRTRDEAGNVLTEEEQEISGSGEIEIFKDEKVAIEASAGHHIPKEVTIDQNAIPETLSLELEKIEINKGFIIDSVYFEFGKAYLKKESLNILDNLIKILKKNPHYHLEVRGHTDAIGNDANNMVLSTKRAETVVDYMIKQGLSPLRLDSKGYGEKNPIASNETEQGRAKNRRTEFFFKKK